MRKVYIAFLGLIIYLLGSPVSVHAQYPASSYGFTAASGTFTEITGGTAIPDIETDDDISGTLPIGFTFNYCGITYTDFIVSSNGWLSFNYSGTSSVTGNTTSNLEDIVPAVFPLWDDLSGAVGSASYITTGTAPNRVLTVEFKDWRWNYSSSYPATISIQIKLYETTNVIEFIYRQETSTGNPTSASIGIGDDQNPVTYLTLNNTSATPTASSTTFTDDIDQRPATGQIYRFSPPPPCSSVTGLPTASTTEVSDTAICVSASLTLTYVPNTPLPAATGFSYLWQSAPALAGPWTTIGNSATPDFTTTGPISSDSYFRGILVCNGSTNLDTASPSPLVEINNPQLTGTTGGVRCGPGTVDLSASTTSGNTLSWYAAPTGGLPLGTGTTFSTPYIANTTDFYVAAGSGITPVSEWIGSGTSFTSGQPNPLYPTYEGNKMQVLITASEMLAAGFGPGIINGAALRVGVVTGTGSIGDTIYNFNISVGFTTITDLTTTFETGLTNVYSAATYVPTANTVNNYPFSTPVSWDGVSNIIVEFCFANPDWGGTKEVEYTSGLGFEASHYQHTDGNLNQCSAPSGFTNSTSTSRPNIMFDMQVGCESPRQAVTATVNPAPVFSIDYDTLVCNDAITEISVNSPLSNYSSYVWDDPNGELYTDATAATAYTGNSVSTVYFRSSDPMEHSFAVAATNGSAPTDCASADTARIWVQPGNVAIDAMPDTICVSGSSELTLMPDSGYKAGSIQWQESTSGAAYSNVAGANSPVYNTPVLTTERYFKSLIRWENGICEEPVQHMLVADPQIMTALDSFHCGPGAVFLEGTAGTNSTLRWYDESDGGTALHIGNQFTTPLLQETDTFWVAAGVGAPSIPPTFIGSGTATTSSSYSPFYHSYETQKTQMLITAAEMTTAGFNAGIITHIGFEFENVPSGLPSYDNLNISVKNTTVTSLTNTFETGLTTVYEEASFMPTGNQVNDFTLTAPFFWDGSSNVVIEVCYASTSSGYPSPELMATTGLGFEASHYQYADNSPNQCTAPTGFDYTSTSRVNIQLTISSGCESPRQPVIAFIHPDPAVDLGNDINNCVDSGAVVVLDAGAQPNNPVFRWDDNSASQVRAVNTSGDYYVEVTNQWGCVESDTISVILRDNPVVALGNDTSVCEDVVLTLDAGPDGIEYFWSNGMTDQVIDVNDSGTYTVLVTNDQGCTRSDTIRVDMEGQLPSVQGIDITNNGANMFTFNAINPQHVIGYQWDFGDGSAPSYQQSPTHTYPQGEEDYVVTLTLSSTCGFISDSTSAHIVGIGDLDLGKEELLIFPNPTRERATIQNNSAVKMEQIEVFNLLGQRIYLKKADNPDKHVLQLDQLAAGVYHIQIYTDQGIVNRKLEILR